jgi:hypothetical protein
MPRVGLEPTIACSYFYMILLVSVLLDINEATGCRQCKGKVVLVHAMMSYGGADYGAA